MDVVLRFVCFLSFSVVVAGVWPPPRTVKLARDSMLRVSPDFTFRVSEDQPSRVGLAEGRLARGVARYTKRVQSSIRGTGTIDGQILQFATVLVRSAVESSDDDVPSEATNYDYEIDIERGEATLNSTSIYGALYAMESFCQLLEGEDSLLPGAVFIRDSPDYKWRGLMVDSGRRFVNVATLKNIMDTMSAVKLNVLHLHASDLCRWAVESKIYPNLTNSLTGIHGGFYTQSDVADIISYAADRGLRVIPEFDVPGHAHGMIPLESEGVEFCEGGAATRDQLYNDPDGKTYSVVYKLMREMAGIFKDKVFHIGCDETAVVDRCSLNSTYAFEHNLLKAIQTEFNKTAETWEEGNLLPFYNVQIKFNSIICSKQF